MNQLCLLIKISGFFLLGATDLKHIFPKKIFLYLILKIVHYINNVFLLERLKRLLHFYLPTNLTENFLIVGNLKIYIKTHRGEGEGSHNQVQESNHKVHTTVLDSDPTKKT